MFTLYGTIMVISCVAQIATTSAPGEEGHSVTPTGNEDVGNVEDRSILADLRSRFREVRIKSLKAVAMCPEDYLLDPPILIEVDLALVDDDPQIRLAAIEAVTALGGDVRRLTSLLKPLMESKDQEERLLASSALVVLGADAELMLRFALSELELGKAQNGFRALGPLCYVLDAHYASEDVLWITDQMIKTKLYKVKDPLYAVSSAFEVIGLERHGPTWFAFDRDLWLGDPWFEGENLYFYDYEHGDFDMEGECPDLRPAVPANRALAQRMSHPQARTPLDKDFTGVRLAARLAGTLRGAQALEVLDPLQGLLKHPHIALRVNAAEALTRLEPNSHHNVIRQILDEGLREESILTRIDAARSYLRIDPSHRVALDSLQAGMASQHQATRIASLKSIGELAHAGAAKPFVSELISFLEKKPAADFSDHEERTLAAIALGLIGPEARTAVPILVEVVKTRYRPASTDWVNPRHELPIAHSLIALRRIGETETTVPAMIELFSQRRADFRKGTYGFSSLATQTLGSLGPAAKDAVPVLIGGLVDEFSSVRIDSAEALGQIGPAAQQAIPPLRDALKDVTQFSSPRARVKVAQALWRIDRRHREVEPVLIEALRHGEFFFERRDAARVLGEIGPQASGAVPALTEALNDPHPPVREAAATALESIKR